MTAVIPDVLADPVGVVVALVAAAEPALSRTAVEDLVISVAAGRAKRRKLAGALAERPAVLSDGRSPGSRRRSALSAARTWQPCSAAGRTGTAESAARAASAAGLAAAPGR